MSWHVDVGNDGDVPFGGQRNQSAYLGLALEAAVSAGN